MKRVLVVLLVGLLVLVAAGCTAGPNQMVNVPNEDDEVAGFWTGLWQGFIAPFAFLVSLFNDSVHVFEVHNNGNWYVFGFLLGASIIFGGSSGGASHRRKRKNDW